jgi:hypothetical protein
MHHAIAGCLRAPQVLRPGTARPTACYLSTRKPLKLKSCS